jgi:hypothetical protein
MTVGVCVLISRNSNPAYLHACFQSLKEQDCTITLGDGDRGNHSQGRVDAYDRCDSEVMTWVDPDDIVEPGILRICEDTLASNPNAGGCATLEVVTDENLNPKYTTPKNVGKCVLVSPLPAHHLIVFRRRVYTFMRPFLLTIDQGADWAMAIAAHKLGGLVEIPQVGYYWRRHRDADTERRKRFELPLYGSDLSDRTVAYMDSQLKSVAGA